MADTTYYTQESMKDKKLSDLKDNDAFLNDAITFLKSRRKGYDDETLSKYTTEDVVYDVLEHFRVMNTNEVTMAKDYYFMDDDNTSEKEKQAYARLMYAFDNAKGEGILDGGFAGISDYAEGVLTAPSTYASAAVMPLTAGAGTAAVQASKVATQQALNSFAKKQIGRGMLTAALDGSVAAGSQLGIEINKKKAGETIGEEYDISGANVAAAGVLGGAIGGAAYAIPTRQQYKGAQRLVNTIEEGAAEKAAREADAVARATQSLKEQAATPEGRKMIKWTQNKLLASIDPKLVEEGRQAKVDILSEDLPDGLIGGLDAGTMKRLSAAAVDLAEALEIKPEKGQRITEFLARQVETGDDNVFDIVRNRYGLTRRQLSAVYAAEVSDAARLLQQQGSWINNRGAKITGKEAIAASKDFADKLTKLYDQGMSTVSGQEAVELDAARLSMTTGRRAIKALKGLEDARRAFMTSQPATTMRNNIFGVAMTGIDMLDQINLSILQAAGFGGEKRNAGATFKGATDTLQYLTKDAYVADALVTMLKEDSPELVSRVFMDAASAEASLVRNTKLAKLGTAANALNTMSDHVFKKAVIASYIDRHLAKEGSSLMEYMAQGRIADLPDDVVNKALDESLAFTFQRRFGGKDASDISKGVNKIIGGIHKYGLTTVVPFPRYIASQAKFLNDYTVLNLMRKKGDITAEEFSKQMTGAAMFAGAAYMQMDNIQNGLEWYEERMTTGETTNAQAAMGPSAFIHFASNWALRKANGLPTKEWNEVRKDAQAILLGVEFRPGGGALGDLENAFVNGTPEQGLKVVGDYLSSFTYPAAVVKDFYGQFDARSSYIPQTRDATVSLWDMGGMDFNGTYLLQRFGKALPDFNLEKMANRLQQDTGIEIDTSGMQGLLKWMGGSARTQFQLMDERNRDTGYDAVRHNIFGDGPLRQLDPFMKQITGFTKNAPKNELEMEMSKLQLDAFKVYNEFKEKNTALELMTQQMLQGKLADDAISYIKTDSVYLNADLATKRDLLKQRLQTKITDTRADARTILSDWARKHVEYRGDFNAYVRGEYKALSDNEKEQAENAWAVQAERYGFKGKTYAEAIKEIDASDYDEMEKDTRASILTLWFIQGGKTREKAIKKAATR